VQVSKHSAQASHKASKLSCSSSLSEREFVGGNTVQYLKIGVFVISSFLLGDYMVTWISSSLNNDCPHTGQMPFCLWQPFEYWVRVSDFFLFLFPNIFKFRVIW
jgi:hypothetical protein